MTLLRLREGEQLAHCHTAVNSGQAAKPTLFPLCVYQQCRKGLSPWVAVGWRRWLLRQKQVHLLALASGRGAVGLRCTCAGAGAQAAHGHCLLTIPIMPGNSPSAAGNKQA